MDLIVSRVHIKTEDFAILDGKYVEQAVIYSAVVQDEMYIARCKIVSSIEVMVRLDECLDFEFTFERVDQLIECGGRRLICKRPIE